jgi:hypothetical protein
VLVLGAGKKRRGEKGGIKRRGPNITRRHDDGDDGDDVDDSF